MQELTIPARGRKLAAANYANGNPARMARYFLGKVLCVQADDGYAEGLITETEAYGGAEDAASHAHLNRRTSRTEIMFAPGGAAYVYLCYGLHHMFNIITGPKDSPEAVLVRAVKIIAGQEVVESITRATGSTSRGGLCGRPRSEEFPKLVHSEVRVRTIPPMVNALIGLFLGTTTNREPFERTIWPLCRTILNPAFSKARMACRCETPGSLGMR